MELSQVTWRTTLFMPTRATQTAQVGRRQVELSNLAKVLFPDDRNHQGPAHRVLLQDRPHNPAHVKGRPLSLVRYPDGIGGESFYQKNRPDWAPAWIEHVALGDEKKDYVIATEDASLVWLANLACIELHQMHSRAPHFDKPDYLVFDFDPPPGFKFARVAEVALGFKDTWRLSVITLC
jgi:bifunctional non-homologous end joining protein LigD